MWENMESRAIPLPLPGVNPSRDKQSSGSSDDPSDTYYEHSNGQRINTDATMTSVIRRAHPGLSVTVVYASQSNLFTYAAVTDEVKVEPIIDSSNPLSEPLTWRTYTPPARRLDGNDGVVTSLLKYGKFSLTYKNHEFIVYCAEGRDGSSSFPNITNQYVVHPKDDATQAVVDKLIGQAGAWLNTLHEEIWIFDSGYWQKSAELWQSIAKSRWEDVILAQEEKDDLRKDVNRFFDNRDRYERYRIVWKRGVIYYGPPGNGKTISIKAMANELRQREFPVAPLYVKSLTGFGGPEYSIKQIFQKARAQAPCILVFEDLDSLVTDAVRSYFLNEVDGLSANSGVYMVGSTNHMDRLDPGISKRPSRFDRKFEFPKPDEQQRIAYCEYWRHKLQTNKSSDVEQTTDEDMVLVDSDDIDVDFPKELSPEIARITDGFSFAYLQEAFVATLLAIASGQTDGKVHETKDKFEDLLFWRVIKTQIELLKEQI